MLKRVRTSFSDHHIIFFLQANSSKFRWCFIDMIAYLWMTIDCFLCFRMSGRDIRDVCQQAERHWASKVWLWILCSFVITSAIVYVLVYDCVLVVGNTRPGTKRCSRWNKSSTYWRVYKVCWAAARSFVSHHGKKFQVPMEALGTCMTELLFVLIIIIIIIIYNW